MSSGLSEADTKFIDKLKELGLNYVVDNEYKEQIHLEEWSGQV